MNKPTSKKIPHEKDCFFWSHRKFTENTWHWLKIREQITILCDGKRSICIFKTTNTPPFNFSSNLVQKKKKNLPNKWHSTLYFRPVTLSASVACDLIGLKFNSFVKDLPGGRQGQINDLCFANYLGAHCTLDQREKPGSDLCSQVESNHTQLHSCRCAGQNCRKPFLEPQRGTQTRRKLVHPSPPLEQLRAVGGTLSSSPYMLQSSLGFKAGKLGRWDFSSSPLPPRPSRVGYMYSLYFLLYTSKWCGQSNNSCSS